MRDPHPPDTVTNPTSQIHRTYPPLFHPAIEHRTIEKDPPKELSLLLRLIASRKHRTPPEPVPERTILDA